MKKSEFAKNYQGYRILQYTEQYKYEDNQEYLVKVREYRVNGEGSFKLVTTKRQIVRNYKEVDMYGDEKLNTLIQNHTFVDFRPTHAKDILPYLFY